VPECGVVLENLPSSYSLEEFEEVAGGFSYNFRFLDDPISSDSRTALVRFADSQNVDFFVSKLNNLFSAERRITARKSELVDIGVLLDLTFVVFLACFICAGLKVEYQNSEDLAMVMEKLKFPVVSSLHLNEKSGVVTFDTLQNVIYLAICICLL
jgi:hypothetical protein